MKRRNLPITLSTLPARTIYHAVLQFTQHHPRPHTKGRKPLYPKALILTLALLRTARRASYRHLLFCLAPEALPDQPVPALGTLLYRLKTIALSWDPLTYLQGTWRGTGAQLEGGNTMQQPVQCKNPTRLEEVMKMKWMIGIGLAACLGQLVWGQPVEDLSSFSREQLQQLREQLKEQETQLMSLWIDEELQADEEIKKHRERSLLQTDLPQPGLANDMMLVRIVGIRRVDEEVWRVDPGAPKEFPYYELQAQVVKAWSKQQRIEDIYLSIKQGDSLRLLWMGCKREGGRKVASDMIWEVDKQYIVPIRFFPTWPFEDEEAWHQFHSQPRVDRVWWLILSTECCGYPKWASKLENFVCQVGYAEGLLGMPTRPVMRIEEPFEEQVQVLDEEAAYYRLATREQRIQWAKQRVQNTNLPLWKRQRALLYLYIAYNSHDYEEDSSLSNETLRQQYPGEKPYVVRGRLRSRRVVEYLTYLQGLSEPLLQAFGLRVVDRHGGLYSQAPAEEVERWVKIVESFLEAGRPVVVRREAAELLANKLGGLFFAETDSHYYVKATESDWAWLRVYAQVLRSRWEREQDKVVRAHLAKGWASLLSKEVRRQLEAIEKRLRELGWGG
jgi:hypothetical protein